VGVSASADATDSRVTILISSFDGFKECWPAVCHGFAKYWPDCPFKVRLMTNELDFSTPVAQVIKTQGGKVWGDRMVSAMDQIASPFVMYFQEDYWIRERVDTPRILEYVNLMEREQINYLRLLANPRPDKPFPRDSRLGILADDAPYRTSSQIALWRTDTLRTLLRPGESVWDFELQGSVRSAPYSDTFLSVWDHHGDDYFHGISYVCTAINSGRWARMAHDYAQREGLALDFSTRPTETYWHEFQRTPLGRTIRKWVYRLQLLFSKPGLFLRKAAVRFR
jgi:hypothetical protein